MPCEPGVLCPTVNVSPVVMPGAPMLASVNGKNDDSGNQTSSPKPSPGSQQATNTPDTPSTATRGPKLPSNLQPFAHAPYFTHNLVATGVSRDGHHFNEARLAAFVQTVHDFRPE
jgi:hypothetical protein